MELYHCNEQQSLHSPQILVLWICWWSVEEERIQPYYPWQVFFIVSSSKKVTTVRLDRRTGFANGVVKCSHRGINHGWFVMCWKFNLGDIAICSSSIPKEYEDWYRALYARSREWMASKKRSHLEIDNALAIQQTLAVTNLLEMRGVVVSGGVDSSPSTSIHSLSSVQSSHAVKGGPGASHSSISPFTRGSKTSTPFALFSQSYISASIQSMDIRKSHIDIVEMAIADFFHCENIPDAVVESPRFKRLVKVCRFVGEGFVVPNRKKSWWGVTGYQ